MLRQGSAGFDSSSVSKYERLAFKFEQFNNLPGSAVLLEAIRPLEAELIRREIIKHPPADTFQPLWFLAEKERNQLLWMHGLSIEDANQIEWWIDVPLLIERVCSKDETGFGLEFSARENNHSYFQQLADIFLKIYLQSFEVSLIARSLALEKEQKEKPIILLPFFTK